jgi:CHAT domain-containing protein
MTRFFLTLLLLLFFVSTSATEPVNPFDMFRMLEPLSKPNNPQPQSDGEWQILDKIIEEESSNSSLFSSLIPLLTGPDCEKDDASAQNLLQGPMGFLGNWLKGRNDRQELEKLTSPQDSLFPKSQLFNTTNLSQIPFTVEVIAKAIPIYKGTIAAMVRLCGINHIRVARGLNFLAGLYRSQKDYTYAEKALLDAVKIMQQDQYQKHPDTAGIHNNLGLVYLLVGDDSNAKEHFEKAVTLAKQILEAGSSDSESIQVLKWDRIRGLQNLASAYASLGNYAKAEQYFQIGLDTLTTLKDLPSTKPKLSRFEQARAQFRGDFDGHEEVALRQNMAHFYALALGDYEKAKVHLQNALDIINQQVKGPYYLKGAIHHGLGCVYQYQSLYQSDETQATDSYTKAEEHYSKAWQIYQQLPTWKYSAFSVGALTQLGILYEFWKKTAQADQFLTKAIDLARQVPESQSTRDILLSGSLYHLAMFYQWNGEFAKAETHLQEALALMTNILGQKHASTVEMMQHFIALKFDQQQIDIAVAMAKALQPDSENMLKNILSFGTEHQRLTYQKRSYFYDLLAQVANETGEAVPLANAILHNKGIVLDSLMEDYQLAGSPEIKDKMLSLKGQLMKMEMEIPQDYSEAAKKARSLKKEKLEIELKKLESGMARQAEKARQAEEKKTRWAFDIDVEQVQNALSKESVLVEFIRYHHFVGWRHREAHYGAVIISNTGNPTWVYLGKADAIESHIVAYQQMMRCNDETCPDYDEETVTEILQTLYEQIWSPIEKQFAKGIKTVILSPDGELNFVSFATLLTPPDSDFLVQKFDLYYVASGRDLLRKPQSTKDTTITIYALSHWNQTSVVAETRNLVNEPMMSSVERQAYLNLDLDSLDGTLPEANALKKMAQSKNWTVKTLFNAQATEKQLHDLEQSPRILHFATHGVFLQPKPQKFVTNFLRTSNRAQYTVPIKFLSNPMRRSFIALASAQTTLNAWQIGDENKIPNLTNDGILTAEEVSSLKLENTWLTMFSACETGRGEGRSGEGVLGLRRGFVRAGTQNLLMTLWPYKDGVEEIVDFEVEFYEKAIKTQNAPKALNDVQRKWLLEIWMDGGITGIDSELEIAPVLDSVRFFGPFVMSFQGPLGK